MAIPGIPRPRKKQLKQLWASQPRLQAMWLFGPPAMGLHRPGSELDLCLAGPALSYRDRLALVAALDDLPPPWRVDLVLLQELKALLQRIGLCIRAAPSPATTGRP